MPFLKTSLAAECLDNNISWLSEEGVNSKSASVVLSATQLSLLAKLAAQSLSNVHSEVSELCKELEELQKRVKRTTKKILNAEEKCSLVPIHNSLLLFSGAGTSNHERACTMVIDTFNHFAPTSRGNDITARFAKCVRPPNLQLLDKYRNDDKSSSNLYSNPGFFAEEFKKLIESGAYHFRRRKRNGPPSTNASPTLNQETRHKPPSETLKSVTPFSKSVSKEEAKESESDDLKKKVSIQLDIDKARENYDLPESQSHVVFPDIDDLPAPPSFDDFGGQTMEKTDKSEKEALHMHSLKISVTHDSEQNISPLSPIRPAAEDLQTQARRLKPAERTSLVAAPRDSILDSIRKKTFQLKSVNSPTNSQKRNSLFGPPSNSVAGILMRRAALADSESDSESDDGIRDGTHEVGDW